MSHDPFKTSKPSLGRRNEYIAALPPAIYEAGSTFEWIVTPRENSALNDRSGSASFWW